MKSIVCYMWDDDSTPPAEAAVPGRRRPVALTHPLDNVRQDNMTREQRREYAEYIRYRRSTTFHRGRGAYARRTFKPEHVNVLAAMFRRHLPEPHRFICVTDKSDGLDSKVEFLKTPDAATEAGRYRSPEGTRFPSCYRRLWSWSPDATVLGERIMVVDIDLVVTRDITPAFKLQDDFVGWRPFRDWGRQLRVGGGIYLMTPGTNTFVWTDFKGQASINEARAAGFRGSDQAWISYKLAKGAKIWGKDSGLYSIRDLGPGLALPKDARLVQFNGREKPWDYKGRLPWVDLHWR